MVSSDDDSFKTIPFLSSHYNKHIDNTLSSILLRVTRHNSVYDKSVLVAMLAKRQAQKSPTILLATDIDNTFITNFQDRLARPSDLMADLVDQNVPVAYITGISEHIIAERIQKGELPAVAAFATYVGTQIWIRQRQKYDKKRDYFTVKLLDGSEAYYLKDETYEKNLKSKGFDRRRIVEQGQGLIDAVAGEDAAVDSNERYNLTFQLPKAEETFLQTGTSSEVYNFKVSFFFYATSQAQIEAMRDMAKAWFGHEVIICEELGYGRKSKSVQRKKYCLDILPCTKASAVDYLSEITDVDFAIVAGDSGNDIKMLTESGDVSIIVGGAQRDLTKAVNDLIAKANPESETFGSFEQLNGNKLYYREAGDRLGPESIAHALALLEKIYNPKH